MADVVEVSELLTDNGLHYVLFSNTTSFTWYEAEEYCDDLYGTHLASIHSNSENAQIYVAATTLGVGSEWIWLGLNDLTLEGNWSWTDGTSVTYTNWYIYEPNNYNNEDCVNMWASGSGDWNDLACNDSSRTFAFVCNAEGTLVYFCFCSFFIFCFLFCVLCFVFCAFFRFLERNK